MDNSTSHTNDQRIWRTPESNGSILRTRGQKKSEETKTNKQINKLTEQPLLWIRENMGNPLYLNSQRQ